MAIIPGTTTGTHKEIGGHPQVRGRQCRGDWLGWDGMGEGVGTAHWSRVWGKHVSARKEGWILSYRWEAISGIWESRLLCSFG